MIPRGMAGSNLSHRYQTAGRYALRCVLRSHRRIDSMLRVYIDISEIQARLLRSVSAAFCAPLCSAFRSAFCSVLSRELEVLA